MALTLTLIRLLFLLMYSGHVCADITGASMPSPKLPNGEVEAPLEAIQVLNSPLTTVFLPIVYIIVFVVGLPANALAIWVFLFRMKKKKNPGTIYMANLALADLLFVILVPLKIAYHFNGNNWIYGEALCKVLVAFFNVNMYSSILFITCISVQRYWAVAHPLSPLNKNNCLAVGLSVAVWVVVWAVSVPLYLYKQELRVENMKISTCHDLIVTSEKEMAAGYFLTMGTLGFVVPLIVCIVSYVLMMKGLKNTNAEDKGSVKNRRKTIRLIITALVMFIFCFMPSNIMLLVHYGLVLKGVEESQYGVYITTLCLASLNSCIDPFLYYFMSKTFRDHIKNTLRCRSVRTAERKRIFNALKNSRGGNIYTSNTTSTQTTDG